MKSSRSFSLDGLARILWAVALLTLPVTSFRYFPAGDATYVRPLAFFPLALLLPILLIQLLRGKTTFPRAGALTPLIAFLFAALAASLLGVLFAPLALRGQDAFGRVVRAWATIFIGLAFFIAAIWMNRDENDLRFTIQWMLAGLALDVLWSGLQGATFYLGVLPKSLVTQWQRAFSMRELIKTNRINGMAYEPSWLAGQISTIYLPWLFASLLTRVRMTRFKWLEPTLLVCAVILLLATFSRGGLLTVGATVVLTLLLAGRAQIRSAWIWFVSGFQRRGAWLWRAGLIVLSVAVMAGALLFLGQKGYIARLWNSNAASVEDFIIQNSAGARAAYIWGALGAYQDHPLTGVGLGASGFYIYNNLPDWALTFVPEIARQLSPDAALYPNPKNLYVRLLAETGLIGFFLFIAFLFSVLGDIVAALNRKSSTWQYLGAASLFTWIALVFYNMTQDSLAIPNLWINFGILAGMSAFAIQSNKVTEEKA
ncbi:MAG: O-antigen ligase family protein [Chloroflexi bacterium]|nr:O-antigen ligase family protein [Chloroflexota bacterium]MBI3338539.1 O-antigen ligase family protein [Chloroflexota bacterium]